MATPEEQQLDELREALKKMTSSEPTASVTSPASGYEYSLSSNYSPYTATVTAGTGLYSNTTITNGGYSFANTISTSPWGTPISTDGNGKLNLSGENADLIVNGMSLKEVLHTLSQRLNILVPAPELEAEWEELKVLGEKYRKLEADIREKQKIYDILSKPTPKNGY